MYMYIKHMVSTERLRTTWLREHTQDIYSIKYFAPASKRKDRYKICVHFRCKEWNISTRYFRICRLFLLREDHARLTECHECACTIPILARLGIASPPLSSEYAISFGIHIHRDGIVSCVLRTILYINNTCRLLRNDLSLGCGVEWGLRRYSLIQLYGDIHKMQSLLRCRRVWLSFSCSQCVGRPPVWANLHFLGDEARL